MERRGVRATILLCAVLLVAVSACGSSGPALVGPSLDSAPFTVGHVPSGYALAVAGTGTDRQRIGAPSEPSDNPFILLSRNKEIDGAAIVVVAKAGLERFGSLAGFDGPGWSGGVPSSVNGRAAIYAPKTVGGDNRHVANFAVVTGPESSVIVSTPDAAEDNMAPMAAAIVPGNDPEKAPGTSKLPAGLSVTGHVDAAGVIALRSRITSDAGVPGAISAHTVGWRKGEAQLLVSTLPGSSLDVAALAALELENLSNGTKVKPLKVGGRPAMFLDLPDRTVLVAETLWGDVVVVSSVRPRGTRTAGLDMAAITEVAASVRHSTASKWQSTVDAARSATGVN